MPNQTKTTCPQCGSDDPRWMILNGHSYHVSEYDFCSHPFHGTGQIDPAPKQSTFTKDDLRRDTYIADPEKPGKLKPADDTPPRATDEQVEQVREIEKAARWLNLRVSLEQADALQALLSELEHLRERERAADELVEAVEGVAERHDESCACDFYGVNRHGAHEDNVCDCARKPLCKALAHYKESRGG